MDAAKMQIIVNANKMENNVEKDNSEKAFTERGEKIKTTFKFPNNMVATCCKDGCQIGFLQGSYSKELHDKLEKFADKNTEWIGFNEYNSN